MENKESESKGIKRGKSNEEPVKEKNENPDSFFSIGNYQAKS